LIDDAPLAVQVGSHQRHAGRSVVGKGTTQRLAIDGEGFEAAGAAPPGRGQGAEVAGQNALERARVQGAEDVRELATQGVSWRRNPSVRASSG
jgi:hypothetical protein